MGRPKSSVVGLLMTTVTLCLPAVARSGSIYVEGYNSDLGILNPTTGAITEIGPTLSGSTPVKLGGLGIAANGQLYGLGTDQNFYEVNANTGALTFIASTSIGISEGFSMGNSSNGTLYAEGNGVVYTVNPSTGSLTTLGNLGFDTGADINGDANGNLYIIQNNNESLYSVSLTTGAATRIGPGNYGTIFGMAYTNGTMYAMQFNGTGIYSLNLATGADTLVSNYDPSIIGSIYTAAAQISSVPEPSGFILLGVAALIVIGMRASTASGIRRLREVS
jgi:hypothetical protein